MLKSSQIRKSVLWIVVACFAVAPIVSIAAAKDVNIIPECSAKTVDDWQHRSFSMMNDALTKLPAVPCLMSSDTGAYIRAQRRL